MAGSAAARRQRSSVVNEGSGTAPMPASRARPAASDDLVRIFIARSARALTRIAERMPRDRLVQAVGAATDADVLFQTLQDAAAIGAEIAPEPDPLTAALLRGAEAKREMLRAEGGVLSAAQLAAFLGITVAGLNKRRERNRLFWLEVGDGFVYPAFQLGPTGLAPGVREVLDAFTVADPWMRVHFMLTGDRRLGGRRPLDLLRAGEVEPVVRAAAAYGEHGAA
jgi:hypothetical protein